MSAVWLMNVLLVLVVIVLILMAVKMIAQPPRTIPEGLFEAHKVVLVGNVNFAGVGLIETFLLAPKLTHDQLYVIAFGQIGLVVCVLFATFLLIAALTSTLNPANGWLALPYPQIAAGLVVFGVVAYVYYYYKTIDDDFISQLMAAAEPKR